MSEMRIGGPQGTLVADVGGAGDHLPVLFLHSDGGNAGHWAKQLAHLRPTQQAIALDLRGHGRSDAPRNGDYSIVGRADDVAAAVDALGLARLVVVGHSRGGAVGLQYAGAHPERVAGLLLVDPPTDGRQVPEAMRTGLIAQLHSPEYEQMIWDDYASQVGSNPAVAERVLADVSVTLWLYLDDPPAFDRILDAFLVTVADDAR